MKMDHRRKALLILGIYLLATFALLFGGYSVREPEVRVQEFPFTITYTYRGSTRTIEEVYVAEYCRTDQYIGDDDITWYGYVRDWNRLESGYCRVVEEEGRTFSINLNIEPGYLMGDPDYADAVLAPSGVSFDTTLDSDMGLTDPAELEKLGFTIDSFDYPEPIENSFRWGGISLSSQATMFTAALSVAALIVCLILIRRGPGVTYGLVDKLSIGLNFLVAIIAFPFILITSVLSEILSDATAWQQLLYLAPAITVLGIAASVVLRRMGHKVVSFVIQFLGPVIFALTVWIEGI